MTHVVCPGSFDPPTLGHIDIVERAARLFDRVTVAVLVNPTKAGLFTVDERLELLRGSTADQPNVAVDSFDGLLVDYCRRAGIDAIVKGLRAVSDFDYELQMAQMNAGLAGIDTVFIPASPEHSFLSSSLVKQVATYGGDVSALLPSNVNTALRSKLSR